MSRIYPAIDPKGLLEYSVVFTDRSVNHMSALFQAAMRAIDAGLKQTYGAAHTALIPGGGTYAMESVARQLSQDKKALVLRNGLFSYRWSQILDTCRITHDVTVLKARRQGSEPNAPFAPAPLHEVIETIERMRPDIVFMPHVETASGMMLPESYIQAVAHAMHAHDGLVVVDCIASGAFWLNMDLGIDVLLSAPQKSWSASPCCGLVMLNERAEKAVQESQSSSFSMDLKKWRQIMQAYVEGGFAYHATLPTDALLILAEQMQQTLSIGLDALKAAQTDLGGRVRTLLAQAGLPSVAAAQFAAPGVVVSHTDADIAELVKAFAGHGVQIAAGVPLHCDEGAPFSTFRLGLFGLDKWQNVERTVMILDKALQAALPQASL